MTRTLPPETDRKYIQGHRTGQLVLEMLGNADKSILNVTPWNNQAVIVDTLCEKAKAGLHVLLLMRPR